MTLSLLIEIKLQGLVHSLAKIQLETQLIWILFELAQKSRNFPLEPLFIDHFPACQKD